MPRRTVALGVLLLLAGCAPPDRDGGLAVFAAASLTKAFTEIGHDFDGASVELSFAGSADLLTQLTQGAVADVFAAADQATMGRAQVAGLLETPPVPFATNSLTIAVAPGNPKGIRSFEDLARVTVVACAVQVPCGATLPRLQAQASVPVSPVSEESSVTDVLTKVTSGQADAGLVYRTDVRAAGEKVSEVPLSAAPTNTYLIAVLKSSRNPALAKRFVDLVTGPTGRTVLAGAGFEAP